AVVFRVEGDDFIILSETKIETLEDDILRCDILKDSLVDFSVSQNYIEDIKEKNEKILDIINK
ncbi:MAG: hypothetical protein U9O83_06775, partial [Campylobacterota bacterium]|nr:hypothetical protein [Campylobacterota bacterium]